MKKKKALSLLLTLCLTLTMVFALAASASADDSAWALLQKAMAGESVANDYFTVEDNTITLKQDITCENQTLSFLKVPTGATVTLNLNGKTINRGLLNTPTENGTVIVVDGTLIIVDNSESKDGKITGGNAIGDGGGLCIGSSGTVKMYAGIICGNKSGYGGAVHANNGTFEMYGGKITGNSATAVAAGALGTVTVGGTAVIEDNFINGEVEDGVYVQDDDPESNLNAVFTLGTGDNAPKDGMRIGVRVSGSSPVTICNEAKASDAQYFFADDENWDILWEAGKLYLVNYDTYPLWIKGVQVTKKYNGRISTNGWHYDPAEKTLYLKNSGNEDKNLVWNNAATMPVIYSSVEGLQIKVTGEYTIGSVEGSNYPAIEADKTFNITGKKDAVLNIGASNADAIHSYNGDVTFVDDDDDENDGTNDLTVKIYANDDGIDVDNGDVVIENMVKFGIKATDKGISNGSGKIEITNVGDFGAEVGGDAINALKGKVTITDCAAVNLYSSKIAKPDEVAEIVLGGSNPDCYGIYAGDAVDIERCESLIVAASEDGIVADGVKLENDEAITILADVDGIRSTEKAIIKACGLKIEAGNNGIKANKAVVLLNCTTDITAGDDGIQSKTGNVVVKAVKNLNTTGTNSEVLSTAELNEAEVVYNSEVPVEVAAVANEEVAQGEELVSTPAPEPAPTSELTIDAKADGIKAEAGKVVIFMTDTDIDAENNGIYANKTAEIIGGTTDIVAGTAGNNPDGIEAEKDITIKFTTKVDITSRDDGIESNDGDVKIEHAKVKIVAGIGETSDAKSDGIYANNNVTLNCDTIDIHAGGEGIVAYNDNCDITFSNVKIVAENEDGIQAEDYAKIFKSKAWIEGCDDGIWAGEKDIVIDGSEVSVMTKEDDAIEASAGKIYFKNSRVNALTKGEDDDSYAITAEKDIVVENTVVYAANEKNAASAIAIDGEGKLIIKGFLEARGSNTYVPIADKAKVVSPAFPFTFGGQTSLFVAPGKVAQTVVIDTPIVKHHSSSSKSSTSKDEDKDDEPVVEPESELPFIDVKVGDWFYDAVKYVYEQGWMTGISETEFGYKVPLNRGMIVTILWRIEGEPVVDYAMTFTDVEDSMWYTEAIRWAAAEGIVEGFDAETFGPKVAITREQLVTILYRYAEYKGYDTTVNEDTNFLSFDDVFSVHEYAKTGMFWALDKGIVQGADNKLMPQSNANRAQTAAMFQRFDEQFAK